MSLTGFIFDIKKYAIHDGPGIRTTVFLKGCPMDCWWCHNPEGREDVTGKLAQKNRTVSVDELLREIVKDRIFYDQSGGGVTFSGGEPLAQPAFLTALLEACRAQGIHTVVDTCGYAPTEDFERISDLTDLFLFDLKIMDDNSHIKYTGVSNEPVLQNLNLLVQKGSKVQLRIPLIPGITDLPENLDAIIAFTDRLHSVNHVSLLPYNRFGEDKRGRFNLSNRLGNLPPQTKDQLDGAAARFISSGYEVKIGG